MRKFLSFLTVALALCSGSSLANAAIVHTDSFATNGALLGTTPTSGGIWTLTGTTTTNPLTVAGGAVVFATTGQDAYSAFETAVPTTAGTSLFSGIDVNVSAASALGDYFFHLSDPVGTTGNFYQRLYIRSSGTGFQFGISGGSVNATNLTTWGSTVLDFSTPYRVVTEWQFVSGLANDIMNVSVNGSSYISGYTWASTLAEPTTNVSAVNLRQGTAANAPTLTLDNIIVATTFNEAAGIAAIPEPSSLMVLGAFGVIGAFARRRK